MNLDGVALVNLAYAYTIAINTGAVPSIQNAWTYICENKYKGPPQSFRPRFLWR